MPSVIGVGNAVATFSVSLTVCDERAERRLVGGRLALDGDEQRTVGARAEPLGEQVVGPADGLSSGRLP